jgi:hypothetical protein
MFLSENAKTVYFAIKTNEGAFNIKYIVDNTRRLEELIDTNFNPPMFWLDTIVSRQYL